jgi:ATP-dependent exoDNAse (exonuclease V) beta subunit
MKIFHPTDIFTFGKYKGEQLDFVYTFHPEYFEWLIKNSDFFAIDLPAFQILHTCPFAEENSIESKYYNCISVITEEGQRICTLREYLTEFMNLYQEHYIKKPEQKNLFRFSEIQSQLMKRKLMIV